MHLMRLKEYQKALRKALHRQRGTSLPESDGTMFMFAHSSDAPWRITKYNVAFFRLPELKKGDLIEIGRKGKSYVYRVTDTKTVWPSDIKYLKDLSKNN